MTCIVRTQKHCVLHDVAQKLLILWPRCLMAPATVDAGRNRTAEQCLGSKYLGGSSSIRIQVQASITQNCKRREEMTTTKTHAGHQKNQNRKYFRGEKQQARVFAGSNTSQWSRINTIRCYIIFNNLFIITIFTRIHWNAL